MHGNSEAIRTMGRQDARERILEAAYDLFAHQGTRSVGVDAIIERSGVAKMTLYRHFKSKQDLVLAFLDRREALWTEDWLIREVSVRATDPKERLLAIFDAYHDWFQIEDFEGCTFINVLLEYQADNPLHISAAGHLANAVVAHPPRGPGMNGFELARRLRAAGSTARLVFLTVHDEEELIRAAGNAGLSGTC